MFLYIALNGLASVCYAYALWISCRILWDVVRVFRYIQDAHVHSCCRFVIIWIMGYQILQSFLIYHGWRTQQNFVPIASIVLFFIVLIQQAEALGLVPHQRS
jgi:hypothetical protein